MATVQTSLATPVLPPGTLPVADRESARASNAPTIKWTPYVLGRLRVVVYSRRLETGGFLAYARDAEGIFAEASTARRAFKAIRAVAIEVARLYADRGLSVPVVDVPREDGDELVGSFVVDA